ncbi:MAG: sulfatase-like hydrolase/transferase [Planctomycetota bacterium]
MTDRPNILLITSDQHRADALGCAGHPCVRTPHLDALAAEGLRFNRAYVDCPVCIPARTTLVTGRQAHRNGLPEFARGQRIGHPRDAFLGSRLTAAGYQTALVGKTHWHTHPRFRAGFETWVPLTRLEQLQAAHAPGQYGKLTGIGANDFSPTLNPFPPHLCSTNWLVDRGIEFLHERDPEQPFFLWVSLIDPHPPNTVHEPYYSMYDGEDLPEPIVPDWCQRDDAPLALQHHRAGNAHAAMKPAERRKAHGVYYGKITNLDHQIGRLLGTLISQGTFDNTVVVYSSDHGEHLGDYGDYSKSTFLDASARVPLIMRYAPWRDRLGGGRVSDQLVQWADLMPTFCQWAHADLSDLELDGLSLDPICQGDDTPLRDQLHGQIGRQHMLLDDRHKYLYFNDDGRELLFDTRADPRDQHDLSRDQHGLLADYRQRFIDHLAHENHPDLVDGRPTNLGRTTLAPRERDHILGWLGLGNS